jgi:hypothetical protein
VVAGTFVLAGQRQRTAEAEVGEVVDRVGLDHGLELLRGLGELVVAKVRPPERSRTELFSGARRATSASGSVASLKLPSSSSSTPRR